jgi:putative ABC transport system permease protein
MIKNYIKTAWRNLINNKVYSALNILGLAIGMAVAMLIGLWVVYQFSYDRFLPGYQQAYQVRYSTNENGAIATQTSVSYPLAEVLKKDAPGIAYVVQTDWMNNHGLVVGEKKLFLAGVMAGPDFLKVFRFPLLEGDPGLVLKDLYSIVLSQSSAKALFGNENPLNKTVRIDNTHDLKVTGIMKDVPSNASFQINYIVPFDYLMATQDWGTKWGNNNMQTFVSLQPNVSYAQVAPRLKQLLKKYSAEEYQTTKGEVFLQPMKDWHLYSEFKDGMASGGFIDYVRLFSIIGVLVLLIACINFMNLSTARSEKRAREVGIRKAVGSERKNLIFQFLIESLVITFIASILSLFIVQAALPAFNSLTSTKLNIPYDNIIFWLIMAVYVLFTGLLAGSRPAFYLSSFNPVVVLKGTMHTAGTGGFSRKILVVIQFTASIALIISTIIVYEQIQYAKDRPRGYDANRLMMSDTSPDINHNYLALKNELLQTRMVSSVTKSSSPVTGVWVINDIDRWDGKLPSETFGIGTIAVSDADFFKTMGMQIKEGRNFSGNFGVDSFDVVLNEAAVARMRFKEPLNQVLTWNTNQRVRVVGVVKNALMGSPFSSAIPTMFLYDPSWANIVTYRLSPTANTQSAITKISAIFNKYNPSYPFIYHFVNEDYADKFGLENLIGKLAGVFAALTIFISCLGLFGLAAYTAEQRMKEIGVRKVLGASVAQVWILLSKDFILLVILGCLIASPLAFYFLTDWLKQYDYRITLQPVVFIAAGFGAIVITLITVSFQAIRAAVMNPVKSLRAE